MYRQPEQGAFTRNCFPEPDVQGGKGRRKVGLRFEPNRGRKRGKIKVKGGFIGPRRRHDSPFKKVKVTTIVKDNYVGRFEEDDGRERK